MQKSLLFFFLCSFVITACEKDPGGLSGPRGVSTTQPGTTTPGTTTPPATTGTVRVNCQLGTTGASYCVLLIENLQGKMIEANQYSSGDQGTFELAPGDYQYAVGCFNSVSGNVARTRFSIAAGQTFELPIKYCR